MKSPSFVASTPLFPPFMLKSPVHPCVMLHKPGLSQPFSRFSPTFEASDLPQPPPQPQPLRISRIPGATRRGRPCSAASKALLRTSAHSRYSSSSTGHVRGTGSCWRSQAWFLPHKSHGETMTDMENPWKNHGKILGKIWKSWLLCGTKCVSRFYQPEFVGVAKKKNFSKYIGLIQSWWGREEKKKTKKMIRVSYETIPFAVIFACSHV